MPSFLHSGDLGDILYFLPAIRDLGGGILYICERPGLKAMTPARFEAIASICRAQPYVSAVEWHKGQRVAYDMTDFRKVYRRGPGCNLATIQAHYINTSFVPNLRDPWLTVEDPIRHGRPILARSPRYHNDVWTSTIWPRVLAEYPNALFIGMPDEHAAFESAFGKVEHAPTADLLHVARLIAGSSIFIGNQSSPYAVAEGLKHPSIQETHPEVADVVFPRANGAFVKRVKDYDAIPRGQSRFALMLQFYEGDAQQAADLTALLADLEPEPRHDIEFILAARFDTSERAILAVERPLVAKFPNIIVHRSARRVKGWPQGCNELWHDSMSRVGQLFRAGVLKADGVFTFEPDCIPCRPDWIAALRLDWAAARASSKLAAGHVCREELSGTPTHMNGNLIISTDIARQHPALVTGSPGHNGWDIAHRSWLLAHGLDAPHIHQTKRIESFCESLFDDARKLQDPPAIWHGIKSNGAAVARAALCPRPSLSSLPS